MEKPAGSGNSNRAAEPAAAKAASMVVVLAKNPNNLRSTTNFLERRGFAAKIVSSLNEAVELFSRKEANKLLLSANFPHPKVEMLPVLMNQSFQIETILFAEDSDRKTQSRLNNAKTKHVLFGPVSGPVVMMKVRQIDRELEGGHDEGSSGSSSRTLIGQEDEADIKIGGRKGPTDDTVVLNGKAETEKKAALDQLMKSLSEVDAEADGSDASLANPLSSAGTFVAKGQRSEMKSETEDGIGMGEGFMSAQAQAMRQGIDHGLSEAPHGCRRLILPNHFKKSRSTGRGPATNSRRSSRARQGGPVEHAPILPDKPASRRDLSRLSFGEMTEDEKRSLSLEERIRTCLREALALVAGQPSEQVHEIAPHNHAALVSLRTTTVNCAFVASLNFAAQTSTELFYRLEVSFFSLLRDQGIEFENEETYSIFLDNKSIVRRAFEASEYVVVAKTDEMEMAVAEVITNNPIAKVQPYEENMHSVSIRDVPVDEPVPFNLFLHFKRNQKYIRYLKKGSSISTPQVRRIEKTQVQTLVDQEEIEAYRRHYAAHAIQGTSKRRAS